MMSPLIQRVVARFAARNVKVAPLKMDPCRHCGGGGYHVEKDLDVKSICGRCFGTATDPDSVRKLQANVEELVEKYEKDKTRLDADKKWWGPGKSNPSFGRRGRELQALKIRVDARREQLEHEKRRMKRAKALAIAIARAAA